MNLDHVPHLREVDRPIVRAPAADPNFLRASEVVADRVVGSPLAIVLGVPFGGGSISGARCEQAPAAIRGALGRFSAYSSDFGVSLPMAGVLDAGDVDVGGNAAGDVEQMQARTTACLQAIALRSDAPLVLLGGDNSVTVGGVAGSGADGLITFDAHHDVRDGISNGSPVRQLLEGGLPGERIVQIGIHGFANSAVYAQRAADAGIAWIPASTVRSAGVDSVVDQTLLRVADAGATGIWIDFDIDCLERAFAPGSAAALPGGLWPADLERAAFVLGASPYVRGMDLTEIDPSTDVAQTTVRTACAVLLAFLAGVASR